MFWLKDICITILVRWVIRLINMEMNLRKNISRLLLPVAFLPPDPVTLRHRLNLHNRCFRYSSFAYGIYLVTSNASGIKSDHAISTRLFNMTLFARLSLRPYDRGNRIARHRSVTWRSTPTLAVPHAPGYRNTSGFIAASIPLSFSVPRLKPSLRRKSENKKTENKTKESRPRKTEKERRRSRREESWLGRDAPPSLSQHRTTKVLPGIRSTHSLLRSCRDSSRR